jgi:hypothetical protein
MLISLIIHEEHFRKWHKTDDFRAAAIPTEAAWKVEVHPSTWEGCLGRVGNIGWPTSPRLERKDASADASAS